MIQVESTQVVLIRFALAAVLADDDARDGLEHFARSHEGPPVELSGRDRALAGRLRDADKVLSRMFDVSQVGKRPFAGDGDVGVQREMQHDVDARRRQRQHELPPETCEIDQRERDLHAARRHSVELELASRVGHCRLCHAD